MKLTSADHIALTEEYAAHNYGPLPVVLARGEGCWVWDIEEKRYLDALSGYSAVNFGHSNPRFIKAATEQLQKMTLSCRAFYNDQLGPFARDLAALSKTEMVCPMNSGAEAVETAIKLARRFAYEIKGVPEGAAEIIAFDNNFAGRTTTIVSFSSVPEYRKNFGPFTPGFQIAAYGDIEDVRGRINKNTAAIIIEPIQGEGGVIIPPAGFLAQLRALCTEENILLIADEVQTGLCRTGDLFACDHEEVIPDLYIVGKSLGAGITPISAVMGSKKLISLFEPGSHGSTFGGNSFACAVACEVMRFITETKPELNARVWGDKIRSEIAALKIPYVTEIRGRGLMTGLDIDPAYGKAKKVAKKLMEYGILTKDTRDQTLRITPPLIMGDIEFQFLMEGFKKLH